MKKNKKLLASSAAAMIIMLVVAMFLISNNSRSLIKGRSIKIENNGTEIASHTKMRSPKNGSGDDTRESGDKNSELEMRKKEERNPISGVRCKNARRRPFAVMMAGDLEAWPLSGIGKADMVVEMPVITGGITRYLAVFVCSNPSEIGSIRSARHDFIQFAMGLDAIFAHWGGSHFALDKLDNKIMDNINALYLDGSVFYRKHGIPKPHDGFATIERLVDYSKRVGYRLEDKFSGYQFYNEENPIDKDGMLTIGYPSIYRVDYKYDHKTNSYLRFKGNKKDKDKLDSKQISAKNVVIMYAFSRQIEGQYNDVDVEGEGKAIVYQNGWEIRGKWKKDKGDMRSKLYFYNDSGEEIKFVPGQIWIQVVEPNQIVRWETEKKR